MNSALTSERVRRRLTIRGRVQGVGFRPFVYRLACELRLSGWVRNTRQGVVIEIEGDCSAVEQFAARLTATPPPRAAIGAIEALPLTPQEERAFTILPSDEAGVPVIVPPPDIAACEECLREVFDPANRRYRYPFTNCTHCGPRFSIIEAMPYDRIHTTMRRFAMCAPCRSEYHDPANRRFHAQPNACPDCGPHLEFWDSRGKALTQREAALESAAQAIAAGEVVAVKGLGGFHLMVDARNSQAVARLRRRKHRPAKPLAVMFPELHSIEQCCMVSQLERQLLSSPEAPIVLLRRRETAGLASDIAPGNPWLGAMLPYTPLHHLLMAELCIPVVATSGNRSEEPICTEEREAVERLCGIADCFLVHDRPIARHVDDSLVRAVAGRELVLRCARGYAPLPVALETTPVRSAEELPAMLAVGGHLKNSVALAVEGVALLSQHIGDLETPQACAAFQKVIGDLETMRQVSPALLVHDAHPDYSSSRYAEGRGVPRIAVQHHVAHVAACAAENGIRGALLGAAWDGTGYGADGTVWGGEFLWLHRSQWRRLAYFLPFPLPGGECAVREPRRSALGLLYALLGPMALSRNELTTVREFSAAELRVLGAMLRRGVNSPLTSSVGRLFDAVASLMGIRQRADFEGQPAMELEFLANGLATESGYTFAIQPHAASAGAAWLIDWRPMARAILQDLAAGVAAGLIAARFHNTLIEILLAVAQRCGERVVALTGGCFQNKYLAERAIARLQAAGFLPCWHRRVPPNDGGIALGQAAMGLYALSDGSK